MNMVVMEKLKLTCNYIEKVIYFIRDPDIKHFARSVEMNKQYMSKCRNNYMTLNRLFFARSTEKASKLEFQKKF